jgi:hypothetical protein
MLGQQRVDLVLALAVMALDLADIDAFGIAAHIIQHFRANEFVVEHDIGLLHQAMGAKGQQVGIARTGADYINGATRRIAAAVEELVGETLRIRVTTGQHGFAHRTIENLVPEAATLGGVLD